MCVNCNFGCKGNTFMANISKKPQLFLPVGLKNHNPSDEMLTSAYLCTFCMNMLPLSPQLV